MGRDDDGHRGCGRVGVEGETARGATLAVCVVLVKLRSAAVRAELEVGEWVWVLHIYKVWNAAACSGMPRGAACGRRAFFCHKVSIVN